MVGLVEGGGVGWWVGGDGGGCGVADPARSGATTPGRFVREAAGGEVFRILSGRGAPPRSCRPLRPGG
eukprot:COSAG04_NODE_26774_length_291_cov_0.520833_1_plen_67_part_01